MTSQAHPVPGLGTPAAVAGPSLFDRLPRWAWYLVAAVSAALALAFPIRHVLTPDFVSFLWMRDFTMYRDAAERFMHGGGFYLPEQLTGPYGFAHGVVLYPPPSVLLFAPFVFLPAFLWWAIPLGVTAAAVVRLRPHPWTWPLMIAAIAWPPTLVKLLTGNPVLWVVAAVALGRLVPWASVLVLLKPSLFPFALLGLRHRSWWVAMAILGLTSLALAPLLPSWLDYVLVVRNAQEPSGPFYSLTEIPMLLLPVIGWLGRTRDRQAPTAA